MLNDCIFVSHTLASSEVLDKELEVYTKCEEHLLDSLQKAKIAVAQPLRHSLNDYIEVLNKGQRTRGKESIERNDFLKQLDRNVCIRMDLFKGYRHKSMRSVLKTLLLTEIRYHCQVIQELSPVLELLGKCDVE